PPTAPPGRQGRPRADAGRAGLPDAAPLAAVGQGPVVEAAAGLLEPGHEAHAGAPVDRVLGGPRVPDLRDHRPGVRRPLLAIARLPPPDGAAARGARRNPPVYLTAHARFPVPLRRLQRS